MELWALGLAFATIGCISSSIGLVLQKHSFIMKEDDYPLYTRWRWWLGFLFLVITGGVLDAVALMFAPLSIISPTCGLTIAANSLFAWYFLAEKISKVEVVATAAVVAGTSLTSAFGSHESTEYDSAALMKLFEHWYIIVYYATILSILAASTVALRWQRCPPWLNSLAFACAAGLLGGNQQVFMKGAVVLIRESVRKGGSDQWLNPLPYILITLTIVIAIGQIVLLNMGLSRHPAVTYLPAYQSSLVVFGCTAGGVYFRDFWEFGVMAWVFFPLGIAIILVGLYVLTFMKTPLGTAKVGVADRKDAHDEERKGLMGSDDCGSDDEEDDVEITPRPSSLEEDSEDGRDDTGL